MTTIATDGKSMAGDTQTNAGGYITRFAPKVHRLADGRIFGGCGVTTDNLKFKAWMEGGDRVDLTDDFCGLILNPDGTVDWIDKNLTLVRMIIPMAVGTGDMMAIGAMLAGKSAAESVAIACQRDRNSGGEITVEHISALREVA